MACLHLEVKQQKDMEPLMVKEHVQTTNQVDLTETTTALTW